MEISTHKLQKNNGNGHTTQAKPEETDLARASLISMLESVPINILLADLNGKIIYMNPQSRETLKSIEKSLPLAADEILGKSYDIFHKNPAHQKKLLSNERNLPHKAIIDVGEERLELLVTAVYDDSGKYIGPMVTWSVITQKLKDELHRSQVMMYDGSPQNVMMCDLTFTINYMNPTSRNTLKKIEKHLPVPVDKIVGGSIDVFHKKPDVQRKILSDPRNLPYQAKIRVGEDTMNLMITPVYDQDRSYVGPMVTWEMVTTKVEVIEALDQASQQLGAAAEELNAVAGQLASNSSGTSEKSTSAAASAEEVSKGVQTVATNTEEMVASIREIAKSSSESASISKEAMKRAAEANATINQLGEASQEIGNVIKVISSIAQQTNLLALNATIEAARAGDAGKGFAVVANEVKELAKQTAKATEDITNKIGAIQGSSKGAIDAIASISKVIEQTTNISMTIAAAVEEQTATTNEVSRVMQESSSAVEGITSTVRAVASAASESAAGASQTLSAAKDLNKLALRLKDLVKKIEI